jgi:hypothetical protein
VSDSSYSGFASCSDAAGHYTVSGVPAGSYQVAFADPAGLHDTQWYQGSPTQAGSTAITVGSAAVTGIDAVLTAQTSVQGTVTDSVSHAPLGNVCAYLYRASDGGYSGYGTCTDAAGQYVLNGMPAGSYVLGFYDSTGQHLTQWSAAKATKAAADPFTLTQGQSLTGVGASMDALASISGTVRNASAQPVSNVCVYADDATGSYTGLGSCTDSSGQFTITGFAPGSYKIAYYPPGTASPSPYWYPNASSEQTASAVTLTAGQHASGIDRQVP